MDPVPQVDSTPATTQVEASSEQDAALSSLSSRRKYLLLTIFCLAQFLDTFNNSALFAAIPPISVALNISNANSVWLLSAYQLSFAAFLLTSGRLSDVYNGSYVFIAGTAVMGFLSLGAGFVRAQVPLIVLRALMGIGAALTVPSALQVIIALFPDPVEQSKAVAIFAGTAGVGSIIGLFIGAALVTRASWPWVFYFIAIVALATGVAALILAPKSVKTRKEHKIQQIKRLDPFGVTTLTIALVLFIFAVTSGSVAGWGTAQVIANLVISVVLAAIFFWWETRIPSDMAALPPSIWHYSNFAIVVATALLPFLWYGAVMLLFSWLWQVVYGWTALKVAVHFLPISLVGIPVVILSDMVQKTFRLKWVLTCGLLICFAGTALLPFADSADKYWRFTFPGILIGTFGVTVVFTTSNIAIFKVTPPHLAGTVGAIYNCALELGCATGVAIITSIQTSVQEHRGGPNSFDGRAAGFWFLAAVVGTLALCVLIFMKDTVPPVKKDLAEELAAKMAAFEESSQRTDSEKYPTV